MFSKNKDWFQYNHKTGLWSRVLIRSGGKYSHCVSVPLIYIKKYAGESQSQIHYVEKEIHISRYPHQTDSFSIDGGFTHVIDDDIVKLMIEAYGQSLTDTLIHADLLFIIDWNKYNKNAIYNTCPLELCIMDLPWFFNYSVKTSILSKDQFLSKSQFIKVFKVPELKNVTLVGGIYYETDDDSFGARISYDFINKMVQLEMMYSTAKTHWIKRHSSLINGDWADKSLTVCEEFIDNQDILDKISEMISITTTNLAIYDK